MWIVSCCEAVTVGGGRAGQRRRRQHRAGSQGLDSRGGHCTGGPRTSLAQEWPRGLAPESRGQGQGESPVLGPHLSVAARPSSREDFSTQSLSKIKPCLSYFFS